MQGKRFTIQAHLDIDPGEYKDPLSLTLLEAGLCFAFSISGPRSPLIMDDEENSAGSCMSSKKKALNSGI